MRRSIESARLLMVFTVLASVGSLARGQEKSAVGVQPKPVAGPRAVSKGVAKSELSDRDCRTYAQQVVAAVGSGNISPPNSLIDWDSLFDTMMKGMEITARTRENLTLGLKKGLNGETSFSGQIVKNSQQGGDFSFLRIRENHGRQVILFRLIQPAVTG